MMGPGATIDVQLRSKATRVMAMRRECVYPTTAEKTSKPATTPPASAAAIKTA